MAVPRFYTKWPFNNGEGIWLVSVERHTYHAELQSNTSYIKLPHIFTSCPRLTLQYLANIELAFYYPRPVLAFGYCHRLRLCVCPCVCVCVYQSLACPHDNSSAVHARITKFETQNTLVKMPIVFGGDRPWPSRSNLTWKSKFTSFWACPHDNFSLV